MDTLGNLGDGTMRGTRIDIFIIYYSRLFVKLPLKYLQPLNERDRPQGTGIPAESLKQIGILIIRMRNCAVKAAWFFYCGKILRLCTVPCKKWGRGKPIVRR